MRALLMTWLAISLGLALSACSPDSAEVTGTEPETDHEEGHVELTEQQFRSAGIEVVQVRPGRVSEALTLTGTVAVNADSVLHVTPRIPGRVREVFKSLGELVASGELLCVIDSVALGEAAADLMRDRGMVEAAEETLSRERQLFGSRLEAVTNVLEGAVAVQERIYQRELELQEKAVTTIRPLLEAEKALQLARLEKDKQLTELSAERDVRLLGLEVLLRSRRVDLVAAMNRLRALGVKSEALASLDDQSPLLSGEYRILAPGDGVVASRHVSIGEFVEAGSELYVIEDLSNVWFIASAFEERLQSLRVGQLARVQLDAFPGIAFEGSVSLLLYRVDPVSRTVGVRVQLDNEQLDAWPEDRPLRPGMFGQVELVTASWDAALVLPERALVHDDSQDYVFVQVEPLGFEHRNVVVRHVAGEQVEILSGLEPGESVAVSGTFFLKSAERQAELGGGHSH